MKTSTIKKFICLIFVLTCMLFVASCDVNTPSSSGRVEIKDMPIINLDGENVRTFETEAELKSFINVSKSTASMYNRYYYGDEDLVMEDSVPTASEPADSPSQGSEYQTNVAVEGVDEADIVKVKGDYIYYLIEKATFVFKKNQDGLDIKAKIEGFEQDALEEQYGDVEVRHHTYKRMCDLYLTDKYLIIRSYINEYTYTVYNGLKETQNYINSTCFDIYDLSTLKLAKSFKLPGSIVSTRLFKNCLYIVNSVSFSAFDRPIFYVDDEEHISALDHIFYYPEDYRVNGFVSLYKLELEDEFTLTHEHILTGYAESFYMSENHMYLLRPYNYMREEFDTYDNFYYSTFITVIDNETLGLVDTIGVYGTILDKYSLNEKDGFLRIVSTGDVTKRQKAGKYYYNRTSTIVNALTIFEFKEQGLEKIAFIDKGIGKVGERIKSARFNGNMLTVVTFRQIDPLYYIDLTDPYNPVITSEFEISGYSVYQHPYKDNYVIGFGYEVENNRNVGYKITLFDVSDKENIRSVGESFIIKSDIGNGYVFAPSFFNNPKELMVDTKNGFFGFNYQSYYYKDYYSSYQLISNYVVIKVDLTSKSPFSLVLELTGDATISNFSRMVYIDNYYYALSNSEVVIYQLVDSKLEYQSKMKLN